MKIKCPDCSTSYEIKTEAVGPEGRSVKCAKCGNRWFVSPDDDDASVDFKAAENSSTTGSDPDETDKGETDKGETDNAETDKDEADWAADSEADSQSDEAEQEPAEDSEPEEDIANFESPPADTPASADESKFAADLAADEGDAEDQVDIESQAKRPKIIVNPDKFRRNHIGALLGWLSRRNYRRLGGLLIFGVSIAALASFVLLRDSMVKQSPDLASLFQIIGFDVNLRGLEFRNLRTFSEIEDGKKVLVVEGSIRNLLDEANAVPAVRLSIRNSDLQEVYAWTVEPRTKALNGFDETRFRTILADPPEEASDIQVRFTDRGKRQIVLE
ncbi:putative Zn finger-like uncharacterized protein [Labrenzia sp. EL_208]|nr:putative Zn finger-like uncharacterized protein [Labrenzia sp. EL_132]MBG6229208.1 putative Zn finger-like uncharacterized protein [Labrenzia sp. EL_208]